MTTDDQFDTVSLDIPSSTSPRWTPALVAAPARATKQSPQKWCPFLSIMLGRLTTCERGGCEMWDGARDECGVKK